VQWIWIILGLMLLTASAVLTLLLRRRSTARFCRVKLCRKLPQLIFRAAKLDTDAQDITALREHTIELTEAVLRLNQRLVTLPRLTAASDGEPRILEVARDIVDEGKYSPDALVHALSSLDEPFSSMEISALPDCICAAQCQRLALVIRSILENAAQRHHAQKLAHRLPRSRKPYALLDKAALNSIGLAELSRALQHQDQSEAIVLLERWLAVHEITTEALVQQDANRQIQLAEELRRALVCFRAMQPLPWLERCEEADHLHALLMNDPAGIYPCMAPSSRQQLRHQTEALARRTGLDSTDIVRHAMLLCEDAEPRSLERYIGYWLQSRQGLRALHRALPTRRGRLYVRYAADTETLKYVLLWAFGGFSGFCFLQSGQPVFMLPFFLLAAGNVIRLAVQRIKPPALPRMSAEHIPRHIRTLVVLPALLHDQHDAVRMVRFLLTASHALGQQDTEYLLLGDFAPAMTVVSGADGPIMEAAASAVTALGDQQPLHYMQRGRAWDSEKHTCCARGGRHGAIAGLLRLIVQGECDDVITCSTLEPSSLERRFDYVFVLSANHPVTPGALQQLLQTMTHPLCERYPTIKGWRGFSILSPGPTKHFDGVGLLRPDALLEAMDGVYSPSLNADVLLGELAGHAAIDAADDNPFSIGPSWAELLSDARRAWRLLPWQLPWVQVPQGVINNPLRHQGRFRLRELLRRALLPLGQLVLLLWAVLTQDWLLLMFALAAPELRRFRPHREELLHTLCSLSLLPTRAVLPLLPLWEILRRKPSSTNVTPALEVWIQGLCATIFAALGVLIPTMGVPALLLAAGFACFPLSHRFLETPVLPGESLTDSQLLLLENAAASTWRFFCQQTEDFPFPPDYLQFEPGSITAQSTSPEAIAAYLLACICARELGYTTAAGAAARIQRILSTLKDFPLPFGLPCRSYALPSLTVRDGQVSAASVGFLAVSLMTTAQALRTWLPELPSAFVNLSADAEAILSRWDLTKLYDSASGFFYTGLDEDSQPTGYIRTLADDGLLLIIAAIARKQTPPECIMRLSRTRAGKRKVPLSRNGTASQHLLAGLFLPLDEQDAKAYITAMQHSGMNGLFGQDECSIWQFDAALQYKKVTIGLPGAALEPTSPLPVFAPYAAALALPFMPHTAAEALAQFAALGAKGPTGYCDAVDFRHGTAPVGLHNAWHQGIILASAAHCLADAPLRQIFCSLPEIEASLPLLHANVCSITLNEQPPVHHIPDEETFPPLTVDATLHPAPLTILGSHDFRILADCHGHIHLFDHDLPLNASMYFYLRDEGRTYRLCSPFLQGETSFDIGEFRASQLCGSLRAEITHCADTLHRRILTVLTITNLSTRDRVIEVADCLRPDLNAMGGTMECTMPEMQHLALHVRRTELTLHHMMDASILPLSSSVCTDAALFAGRTGDMQQPSSLEGPFHDQLEQSEDPCLSFRTRYTLGGRAQLTVWFTTSLLDEPAPQLTELPGIQKLAAMQGAAIANASGITAAHREAAALLLSPLQKAGWQASLVLSSADAPFLSAFLAIFSWIHCHGQETALYLHCKQDVQQVLSSATSEEFIRFAAPDDALLPLTLHGDEPLFPQLERLCTSLQAPRSGRPPIPAKLPAVTLLHPGPFGGFDPDTLDYILQLEPGQLPPVPWTNMHCTRYYRETTADAGLQAPFHEDVQIYTSDGTQLSPWAVDLPRSIRMRPGETDWETWSDQLDIRLRAACLPGHSCGLRALHIHNAGTAPVQLHICVTAHLHAAPLLSLPGVIMTELPDGKTQSFLAGDDWEARILPVGDAELSRSLTLEPQRSERVLWLSGFARHGEDVIRALEKLRQSSITQLLRAIQAPLANSLTTLTIATPEPTLDLLMNRILPLQVLQADGTFCVPALMYIAPMEARRALLCQARKPMSRDEWARFIIHLADYVGITGDTSILHARIPAQDAASLLHCCREALLSVPLTHQQLPQGEDQTRRCFLYAQSAQALNRLSPDPEAADFSRRLLNAADTYLWNDGFYGDTLRLDVQSLACAAYGANPRTRQAMLTCWITLYDRQHGLIRMQDAADAAPLPGLPENGGMVTLEAVQCLKALIRTDRREEACELLMALNPLHHTDTPERQAVFRSAPYQLHDGMYAAPMEAGRATSGGEASAALLYAVVLEDVLGVHLRGNTLRLKPAVPRDWDDFSLTLRVGAATWHISAERRLHALTIDGKEASGDEITLADDGKVHQVRFPLK